MCAYAFDFTNTERKTYFNSTPLHEFCQVLERSLQKYTKSPYIGAFCVE